MKTPAKKLSVLGIGFIAAFAVAMGFTSPANAYAEQDSCSSCGPAPCCEILWTTWCGCPWGDEKPLDEL